jgi:hypothetical protein
MEDGIENCLERSLQAANQVLLLFRPIENPRWPPTGDIMKIFEISANQRLLWALAAMLDDRSEQKVTKLYQDLVRNISTKDGSNTSSGSLLRWN